MFNQISRERNEIFYDAAGAAIGTVFMTGVIAQVGMLDLLNAQKNEPHRVAHLDPLLPPTVIIETAKNAALMVAAVAMSSLNNNIFTSKNIGRTGMIAIGGGLGTLMNMNTYSFPVSLGLSALYCVVLNVIFGNMSRTLDQPVGHANRAQ